MKEFTNRPEFIPKCENEKASLAATAVLENWEPTTILCPKWGESILHLTQCMY